MIERGSGRTSSLTDWHLMDVNSMWACLQDHDTANHWKQVAGWRKICDLAQAHLSRLQEYRRGLAAAWPPASNTAALAYLTQLDELIDKVRRTHDAAATNYTALAAATQAIGGTRTRLQKIHEEYAAKLQQKRAYEATAADPKAAMGSRVTDRPVTDADLEQLNVQARGIMYGLSTELQQAQAALQRPPAVRPPKDPGNPDVYGTSAPAIPAVMPVPLATPIPTSEARIPSTTSRPAAVPGSLNKGPILGSAASDLTRNPAQPSTPGVIPSIPSASAPGISAAPSPLPGATHRPVTPGASPSTSVPFRRLAAEGHESRPSSPPGRPSLPSGIIGGAPVTGQPITGGGHTAARHVNPTGGIIGGSAGTAPIGGAGTRPNGRRGITGSPGALSPNASQGLTNSPYPPPPWPGSRNDRDDSRQHGWSPDNPWITETGVPPVVRPPEEEGPIDPGPAIGLGR
ncbi:hypothetical protein ABZ814_11310 [Micromonospora musae]|uniref:hypothetical protein n=1 Tax=Micromonospora musae TaxID=1894970 RepID=UPI0033CF006A